MSLDQAHDLPIRGRLAPEIRAADARGHGPEPDIDLAPPGEFIDGRCGEAERTFEDRQRGFEHALSSSAALHVGHLEAGILSELDHAAVAKTQQGTRSGTGFDAIAVAQHTAGLQRAALVCTHHPGRHLHRFHFGIRRCVCRGGNAQQQRGCRPLHRTGHATFPKR